MPDSCPSQKITAHYAIENALDLHFTLGGAHASGQPRPGLGDVYIVFDAEAPTADAVAAARVGVIYVVI